MPSVRSPRASREVRLPARYYLVNFGARAGPLGRPPAAAHKFRRSEPSARLPRTCRRRTCPDGATTSQSGVHVNPPPRGQHVLWLIWRDTGHPLGGGSETYAENVAEQLCARGHRVTILCAHYPGAAREEK